MSNPFEFLNDDVKRVNLMSWSFVMIYSFCEMGQMVTTQHNVFEEELHQCSWYLFPMKLQRIHLIVLANAENAPTVSGFGNIECLRTSLKNVRNVQPH